MVEADRSDRVERLLSIQRAARAVADSAATWWQQLSDAADAVITTETLDSFYHLLLTAMQSVLGADEVAILVADPAEEALVTRVSLGLGESSTVSLRIPAGQGMAGRVLASRQPLVVNDLSTVQLVSPTLQERGFKSVVAVPILAEDRILGVIHTGSRELAHFNPDDAELLGMLAERVAIAIERVRLIEDQRRLARFSSFLAETSRIMSGAVDLPATLDALAKTALPVIGDLCIIDMVTETGQLERVLVRHVNPRQQPTADRLKEKFGPDGNTMHPAVEALRMGSSRWSPTMTDEFLRSTTRDDEHFQIAKVLGFRSYIAVPISSSSETIGVLTLVSCSRSFSKDDVTLAETVAHQVGAMIDKAQQLDQELLTSRLLQASLLPDLPDSIPGVTFDACYSAASSALDVGGDFYDVLPMPDGPLWITVGDVEGHDRRAAAEMGQLRGAIRALAVRGLAPEEIVDELRRGWDLLDFTRTATILIGRLDPSTGHLAMASAGHLPPLLIRGSGADYLPVPANTVLGVRDRPSAIPYVTHLASGDVLLLYTDGALRERVYQIEDGMTLLRELALDADLSPEAICSRVIDAVREGDDDAALLALTRDPLP